MTDHLHSDPGAPSASGANLMESELHLPYEVLAAIVSAVDPADKATLAVLLRVCQTTNELAAPLLYADLSITDKNLPGVLHGIIDPRKPPLPDWCVYPTTESNARKRALLAHTTTLRVRSVPEDCASDECHRVYRLCPMDKDTFPAVKTVMVSTTVPYHHDVSARRLSASPPTSTPSP
jgi:hypothetical protein